VAVSPAAAFAVAEEAFAAAAEVSAAAGDDGGSV